MQPASKDIVEAVADALDAQVLPGVTDKWAASTLRSAVVLLRHVALRIEREPALHARHERELRECLAQFGRPVPAGGLEPLQAEAERLLAGRARGEDVAESGDPAEAHYRRLIACLVRQLDEQRELLAPFENAPPI